jgi:hypothetical protein
MDEWLAHVRGNDLPPAAMQVDLEAHAKVSQYLPEITSVYGFNACGLVAAAAALGGAGWLPLAAEIRTASGDAYGPKSGIQPSPYANALQQVFGTEAVTEENEWTFCAMHQALHENAVIIVDIQVGSRLNERREQPTTQAPDYAHFARVLGVDLEAEMIYVENTLGGQAVFWPLPLLEFWEVWKHPETAVSVRAPNPEDVTRWAVIIQPQETSITAASYPPMYHLKEPGQKRPRDGDLSRFPRPTCHQNGLGRLEMIPSNIVGSKRPRDGDRSRVLCSAERIWGKTQWETVWIRELDSV